MVETYFKKKINKKNYLVFNFSYSKNRKLKSEFNKLVDDNYLKNTKWIFRKRSFAKGIINNNNLNWSKGSIFFQSKKINKYAGGIKRKFPNMSTKLKKYVKEIIDEYFLRSKIITKGMYFGVHAIRIVCNKKNKGFPVPEGFHTDGVDRVAIIPVAKKFSNGGISYLKNAKNSKIVFRGKLENKILFFNDRKLLHYATPISLTSGNLGYRDILVFTFLKKNA